MKVLIIVARESKLGEMEELHIPILLRRSPNSAYFLVLNDREIRHFSDHSPGGYALFHGRISNSMIFAVLSSDRAEKAVNTLTALRATQEEATHGQHTPLKVFTFSCEEHL